MPALLEAMWAHLAARQAERHVAGVHADAPCDESRRHPRRHVRPDPLRAPRGGFGRGNRTAFDRVHVVPSNMPWHRRPPAARVIIASRWCLWRWLGGKAGARPISNCGATRGRTRRTLQKLHGRGYTPDELFFVIGADAFRESRAGSTIRPSSITRFRRGPRPGHRIAEAAAASARTRWPDGPSTGTTPAATTRQSFCSTRRRRLSWTRSASAAFEVNRSPASFPTRCGNTLNSTSFTRPQRRNAARAMHRRRPRQAGCMAKTRTAPKTARLPKSIEAAIRAAEGQQGSRSSSCWICEKHRASPISS